MVSTDSRTINTPVRAVVPQWMRCGSSPGTYSRSDAKDVEPFVAISIRPSKSGTVPTGTGHTSCTRGCTQSTSVSPWDWARRKKPNGSRRSTVSGPTVSRPRLDLSELHALERFFDHGADRVRHVRRAVADVEWDLQPARASLTEPALTWLRDNAATYGFVNDVPSEPWQWTYKHR
jgi:hypothetical protein